MEEILNVKDCNFLFTTFNTNDIDKHDIVTYYASSITSDTFSYNDDNDDQEHILNNLLPQRVSLEHSTPEEFILNWEHFIIFDFKKNFRKFTLRTKIASINIGPNLPLRKKNMITLFDKGTCISRERDFDTIYQKNNNKG